MSTKSSSKSTSVWFQFFEEAGIASSFCTTYTKIFDDNAITTDQLVDIDREVLREMKITPMGHILKILKQARKFHEQSKEQEKESNKSTSQSPVAVKDVVTPPQPLPSSKITPKEMPQKPIVNNNKIDTVKSVSPATTSKTSLSSVVKSSVTRSTPQTTKQSVIRVVSSKVSSPTIDNKAKTATLSDNNFAEKKIIVLNKRSTEPPLKEEVPFQKKIRVLPAHEGKYTIKMPEGTTPRTQKLKSRLGPSVTEQNSVEKKSNSVFERLGDSRVSSSTEVKQETSTTAKSRQERSSSSTSETSSKTSAPSVFDRLGLKKSQDEALQSKALLKTKFEVRQEVKEKSPPPPPKKPVYDSKKAYMEKTLTTVHSSLYGGPSSVSSSRPTSSSRLKSEIIAPSYSSSSSASSSSSRLISTKSSSSTSSSSSSYSHNNNQPTQRVQRNETIVRFKGIEDSFEDRKFRPSFSSQSLGDSKGHYDGQVLRTERVPSKNKGKVIIKKYIYKKPSKPATTDDDDELPDNIDDPLADCYQD